VHPSAPQKDVTMTTGASAGCPAAERRRVLLVDDQPLVRAGLRTTIAHSPDLELVGEPRDAREAVRQAARLGADVLVLDPRDDRAALDAVTRLRAAAPGTHVLVLSESADLGSMLQAVRAGARGYVLKSAGEDDIRWAIRAVARGHVTFGDEVAERVLAHLTTVEAPGAAFPDLTGRERDVLEHLARGASTAAIARRLHLAPKTVRNYVSAICAKLGVADRTQAALAAREAGLGGTAA
jgi:DNA-binding NarL/FixJ family response regulator